MRSQLMVCSYCRPWKPPTQEPQNQKKRKITSNVEDNASVGKSSEGDPAPAFESTSTLEDGDNCHKNDIGRWVGRSFVMTTEMRMEMLKRCWAPPENYDYAGDAFETKI
ncbi:unnamed protein product [Arctia plantaginis]|uniref:Uncharacterized protein n=1 Tax=Arctia plantaginis TaxID=874455 RepID=A0A8S1AJW9_ARCPL|nr:unnamed protein product [Arctia plantaginis]